MCAQGSRLEASSSSLLWILKLLLLLVVVVVVVEVVEVVGVSGAKTRGTRGTVTSGLTVSGSEGVSTTS